MEKRMNPGEMDRPDVFSNIRKHRDHFARPRISLSKEASRRDRSYAAPTSDSNAAHTAVPFRAEPP
jgi:hypothetical protein